MLDLRQVFEASFRECCFAVYAMLAQSVPDLFVPDLFPSLNLKNWKFFFLKA